MAANAGRSLVKTMWTLTAITTVSGIPMACTSPDSGEGQQHVVQQVRFQPPPAAEESESAETAKESDLPHVEDIVFGIPDAPPAYQAIPKPKAKKIPIPDPTPDEPEPMLIENARVEAELEAILDQIADRREPLIVGGDLKHLPDRTPASEDDLEPRALARQFLDERATLKDLRFQPAVGYWANTYVPGDPALRHLEARLLGHDRSLLESYVSWTPRLHDVARTTTQPFDAPRHAALDVFLSADRRSLDAPSRLLVQIGLRGTPRHSGRRPAMNVAVVLDLRGALTQETAAALRALVTSLAAARDIGDRFHLMAAGRPEVTVLAPSEFRHGPVTLATQRLLVPGTAAREGVSLPAAMRTAADAVRTGDDPTQPLGSSLVLLVTPGRLGGEVQALASAAHESAVAGMPWSVIGVGDEVEIAELDRLALAGQGHRRLLAAPREAAGLIDRELAAVSRVIARAVRLNLRLSPGVRLIEVVGSRRLDVAQSARVRQAEHSIDQRLQRNLGITADRDEDDEGIQIVIPSFYAGDAHAILIDVAADGPGPIAELTVRYKDLVQLGNGVTRAHLDLPRGRGGAGPLEHNVTKNLLARRLHETLDEAACDLAAGRRDAARSRLRRFDGLLAGLRLEVPGFEKDRDLDRDQALLSGYLAVLDKGAGRADAERVLLADSLRYAAWCKVLSHPVGSAGPIRVGTRKGT